MSALFQLLHDRYGSEQDVRVDGNAVLESLLGHRSVRAFLPDDLPAGTLETLIAAAQSAPSSSNLQAWSVVAVEDQARRYRFADWTGGQQHIRDAPLLLVWLADLSRLERLGTQLGEPVAGLDYLDSFLMGVIDAALAAQNVVTAAESLGLGTVYIGAIRNRIDQVAAELALPAKVAPVFGLVIGHPDPTRPAAIKPRLPQSAVLHREQYAVSEQQSAVDVYDVVMRRFYTAQGLPPQAWSAHSVARVRGPETLYGRDRLREQIEALGFFIDN
ncbi:NADPH-dependent oxidoreductase [Jeongeupia naejangsanensis]|uniref:NADPH-dependent oxidoreductase n=1 Tax=Jeongeupia naejangsanensis TaxID=613195 RepID=A0ABS2BNN4_9NEIS|nr:NADPH-dependent oxidoreductase [Jeongeupia naejangsanensis]MBM3117020.1 NADPH-dependent oxidoreductase [Jeongeupia naejangsanensis]